MTKTELQIEDMTCGGCVNSIQRLLSSLPGVQTVQVSLEKRSAEIEYDPTQITVADFQQAFADAGFAVVNHKE